MADRGTPAPASYGAGLAVLVVGSADAPFPRYPPAVAASRASRCSSSSSIAAPRVAPYDAGADVLRIGEDVGRGAAVNRAVAELPPDVGLVALAPPRPTRLADGALDALRAAADRHPRAGSSRPGCSTPAAPVPSTHPLPAPGPSPCSRRPGRPRGSTRGEGPVGWSSAPVLLLRRAALDSVDGFDPRYPGRLDDLDLADRLARAGWMTVHVPRPARPVSARPRAPPDPAAPRRYLADRAPRPVRGLLRRRDPD